MSEHRRISDADMHAYVDGLCNEEKMQEIEAYLTTHPNDAALARSYLQQKIDLKTTWQNLQRLSSPPHLAPLSEALEQALKGKRGWSARRRWMASSAAAVALVISLGFNIDRLIDSIPTLAEEAVDAHQAISGFPSGSSLEDPPIVISQMASSIDGVIPVVPEIRQVGARIVGTDDGPALQLIYEDEDRRRLSLLVIRYKTERDMEPRQFNRGGMVTTYWQKGSTGFALVGKVPDEELRMIVAKLIGP